MSPSKLLVCPLCDDEFISDAEWDGMGLVYCPNCVADALADMQFPDFSEQKAGSDREAGGAA